MTIGLDLAATSGEWIKYNGEGFPYTGDTMVDVRFRDNCEVEFMPASTWHWEHAVHSSDIVAYRICLSVAKDRFGLPEPTKPAPPMPECKPPKEVNPKQSIGQSKLPLHLWSPLATAYGTVGLANGAGKYGMGNYKATDVILSIYIAATMRHLLAFLEGQECDPVDGTPHIGAILANMAIILDARACGTLIDDRPIQGGYLKELDKLTEIYQNIVKLHADKNPKHYTLADNPEGAIK